MKLLERLIVNHRVVNVEIYFMTDDLSWADPHQKDIKIKLDR